MDQQPATPTAGDFYTARWGVEQTNVDFYEVTRASTRSVWLRTIETDTQPQAGMTYRATPRAGAYRGHEFRRKLHPEAGVQISPGGMGPPLGG